MLKIVKMSCLFTAITVIPQTALVAMENYKLFNGLDMIISCEEFRKYAKSDALLDIINNRYWDKAKKLASIEQLFEKLKPNTNARDSYGFPVLHRAIECGSMSIVKIIIQKGANFNEKNNGLYQIAYTPLQWAILNKKRKIAKFLIQKKVNIQEEASDGSTALHLAARNGYTDIIRTLLNKAIPIEKKDAAGNTALHIAALHLKKHVLKLLIQKGINPTIKNNIGFTAEEITAFGYENPDLFEELGGNGYKRLAKCHAYLKLVTDFYTTLKNMRESTSMFSCFDEDHITETFNRFANTHLIGLNANKNSIKIKNILHLDKDRNFAKRFTDWCKKNHIPRNTNI